MKTLVARREDASPYYWVLKDEDGKVIDRDQYRHDLQERWWALNKTKVVCEGE